MLHEFLLARRADILARSRTKLSARQIPTPSAGELAHGLPLFLDQLIAALRAKRDRQAVHDHGVSESADRHGVEMLRVGLTVGQLVQDYGSICQSVTELADEMNVLISADEFKTFNGCLDEAIAQAVTSYERQRDRTAGDDRSGAEHLGFLAHEMRNLLMTSMLTFEALRRGEVGIHGSTGNLHGRSLRRMRALIDRTLADVRIDAGIQSTEPVSIARLVEEIGVVASLEANERGITLSVDPGPFDVVVNGDSQILASAVANLVQNAFKFTRTTGHIRVRAHQEGARVLVDVEDECGGLPPGMAAELFRPFKQHGGAGEPGLGLGLAISLKGANATGGEIRVRDLPGSGCIFTIDLPIAASPPPGGK